MILEKNMNKKYINEQHINDELPESIILFIKEMLLNSATSDEITIISDGKVSLIERQILELIENKENNFNYYTKKSTDVFSFPVNYLKNNDAKLPFSLYFGVGDHSYITLNNGHIQGFILNPSAAAIAANISSFCRSLFF